MKLTRAMDLPAHQNSLAGNLPINVFLKMAMVVLALFIAIEGSVYQIEMLVMGGRAPLGTLALKMLLAICVVIYVMVDGNIHLSYKYTFLSASALTVFLIVDDAYLYIFKHLSVYEIAWGTYSSYLLIYLAVLSLLTLPSVSIQWIERTIVVSFVLCFVIAAMQYITQSAILPTDSSDGNFSIGSWNTPTGVRTFSLFHNAGEFGVFCAYVMGIMLFKVLNERKSFIPILVITMCTAGCWMSGTRTAFICYGATGITVYLLSKRAPKMILYCLPIVWFSSAVGFAVYLYLFVAAKSGEWGLTGNATFNMRILEWGGYYKDLKDRGVGDILLGQGIIQGDKVSTIMSSVPIDNMYLGLLIQVGLVGMLASILVFYALWIDMCNYLTHRRNGLLTASASLLVTVFALGVFALNYAIIFNFLMLAILAIQPAMSRSEMTFSGDGISPVKGDLNAC